MIKTNYYHLLFVLLLIGCNKKSLKPIDYIEWVNDPKNGMMLSKEIGEYRFDLLYKPSEYIAILELESLDSITDEYIQKRKKELTGIQHLTLTITSKNGESILKDGSMSPENYQNKLYYFTTLIKDDLKIIQAEDTFNCLLTHFERNYELAPYNKIVLIFEDNNPENKSESKLFNYYDNILEVGPVLFTIRASALGNLPELKID